MPRHTGGPPGATTASVPTRSRTRSSRRFRGIGRASPVARVSPRNVARAISNAKNGFPPDVSAKLVSAGGGNPTPRRVRTSSDSSSTVSGTSESRVMRSSGNARASPSGSAAPAPRVAINQPIGPSPSRRTANSSARTVETSSHWTSSSATRTGPRDDASPRTVSAAAYTARGSGGGPVGAACRSATSSAVRCGSGRNANRSRTPSNRSARPAKESVASDSAGRIDEHAPATIERPTHTSVPERRLPDPRRPVQHERRRPVHQPVQERIQPRELVFPPDDVRPTRRCIGSHRELHAPLPVCAGQTPAIPGGPRVLEP